MCEQIKDHCCDEFHFHANLQPEGKTEIVNSHYNRGARTHTHSLSHALTQRKFNLTSHNHQFLTVYNQSLTIKSSL